MRKYSAEHKENNSIQWRIQDLQTGARSSAAGARIEALKAPRRDGVWGGVSKFF